MIEGHAAAIEEFAAAMRGPRLHHGWILGGPRGVGKATLARALATRMLADAAGPEFSADGISVPESHPTAQMMRAGSHPDFRVLERLPKDEKLLDKPKADWPTDYERNRNIKIDQVRALSASFATRPSLSHRRVVLVDSVDDLETQAANALLKSLEEPPAGTIFLLVSHMPGRLLPTIRSRCQFVRFGALDDDAMGRVLRDILPGASQDEIEALVSTADGSPGGALKMAGLGLAEMDAALSAIARSGDASNALRSDLARKLSAKPAAARYEAFLARAPSFIAGLARERSGDALLNALDRWEAVRTLALSAQRLSNDPATTVFTIAGHVAALAPQGGAAKA